MEDSLKRTFVISDIHGEVHKLKNLIDKLSVSDKDTIVFLGDYIDRGVNSFEVIDYLIKLKDKYSCIFLRGNHEVMFINYLVGVEERMYLYNGGQETIDSYKNNGYDINRCIDYTMRTIPDLHGEFLITTKLYHETDDYIFVHAGIHPNKIMSQQYEDTLFWKRDFYYYYSSKYKGPKTVVYGHTPGQMIKEDEFAICIDTGACFSGMGYGHLTCLELPNRVVYRQGDD